MSHLLTGTHFAFSVSLFDKCCLYSVLERQNRSISK